MAKPIDLEKVRQAMQRGKAPKVDPKHIEQKPCLKCNCPYYISVIRMGYLSVIASPTGEELYLPTPTLICISCSTEFGVEPKKGGGKDGQENIQENQDAS